MWSNCRLLLWRGTWSKKPVPDFITIDPYWSLVSCWPFVIVYRTSSTCTIGGKQLLWQLGLPTELSGSPKHWNPIATCIFPASPVSLLFFLEHGNLTRRWRESFQLFEILLLPRVSLSCGPENAGGKGLRSLKRILWEPMVFFPTSGKRLKGIWWHQRSLNGFTHTSTGQVLAAESQQAPDTGTSQNLKLMTDDKWWPL